MPTLEVPLSRTSMPFALTVCQRALSCGPPSLPRLAFFWPPARFPLKVLALAAQEARAVHRRPDLER